jgi:hypothetical protein
MSTQSTPYIQPTYGFFGALTAIFNAVGASASAVNNVASGAAEFTADLPRLGKASGEALSARAELNLRNQLELTKLTD